MYEEEIFKDGKSFLAWSMEAVKESRSVGPYAGCADNGSVGVGKCWFVNENQKRTAIGFGR